jgi:hypothetical protein
LGTAVCANFLSQRGVFCFLREGWMEEALPEEDPPAGRAGAQGAAGQRASGECTSSISAKRLRIVYLAEVMPRMALTWSPQNYLSGMASSNIASGARSKTMSAWRVESELTAMAVDDKAAAKAKR